MGALVLYHGCEKVSKVYGPGGSWNSQPGNTVHGKFVKLFSALGWSIVLTGF